MQVLSIMVKDRSCLHILTESLKYASVSYFAQMMLLHNYSHPHMYSNTFLTQSAAWQELAQKPSVVGATSRSGGRGAMLGLMAFLASTS